MTTVDPEVLRQRYLADFITTATPAQRLLMLFDGLLNDLDRAEEAFGASDYKLINDHLVHAQHILFALRDVLDTSAELGSSLATVYGFCITQLVLANLRKDPSLLPPVREIVTQIADANRRAAADVEGAALSA